MKPAAGVTATRPTTIAVAAPTAVGLPCRIASRKRPDDQRARRRQHRRREGERRRSRSRRRALPALNPNQPNQSRPAPSSTNGTLCGISADDLKSWRLPDDQRGDQRRDAGVDVHDGAAGEVERAHLGEPAAAPDPVGDRAVDDDRPQRDEEHVGRKAHALDDRARRSGPP